MTDSRNATLELSPMQLRIMLQATRWLLKQCIAIVPLSDELVNLELKLLDAIGHDPDVVSKEREEYRQKGL